MCDIHSAISVYIDEPKDKTQDSYALYLISAGYAQITINHVDYHCISPAILCLNDRQQLYIRSGDNLTVSAAFFSPEFLSKALTNEVIHSTSLRDLCQNYDFLMMLPFICNYISASIHNNVSQNAVCSAQSLLKDCAALLTDEHPLSLCRARAKLIDCLHLCENAISDSKKPHAKYPKTLHIPENYPEVKQALHIIWNSYSDPAVNTAYLLEELHINKEKLSKQFREAIGTSPYQYLLQYRLSIACDKLLHTNDTIDHISEVCGFTTYITFTTIFKKKLGVSPSAFRIGERKMRKQKDSA